MATKWCQECEEMVQVFPNRFSPTLEDHERTTESGSGLRFASNCYGLFYESAPPELPEGWELMVEEPGSDELSLINVAACQLLLELEGA